MLEIKKIRLCELDSFLKSELFCTLDIVPITPLRAASYLNNPRANPNDVVLYLGFINQKIVAFRSLFADLAFTGAKTVRFAWCSGSWVRREYRRKGYSQQLLAQAFDDWNGKLMLTNYSPATEKLFQKTGWFAPIHQFQGTRAYLFPKTRKLLAASQKNGLTRLIASAVDIGIKVYALARLQLFSPTKFSEHRFQELQFPDKECYEWTQSRKSQALFRRGEAELKWIFKHPWISGHDSRFQENYPFSSYSNEFYYCTIKIFRQNTFAGFFIFSVREGHLKTLHFDVDEKQEAEIAAYLKNYCVKNKIEMATIYNSGVAGALFKQKFPFLRLKKMGQKIYSTFSVSGAYSFQDGDGDVSFT